MKSLLLNSAIFLVIACSCESSTESKPRVTSLGVYKVIVENNKPKMGAPLYKEAFEYNSEGQITQHFQYDALGIVKSREIYPESYPTNDTIRTSFYDANNVLLSNYKKIYNEANQKEQVWAYDASTNELLRREEYSYDIRGNLADKRVFTSEDQLYRHQHFSYDKNDNEISVDIKDENGNSIFEESYEISSVDGRKMWTEKWGYTNGNPTSFRKRVLEYN